MISPGGDPEGATPLEEEELAGLRPSWVATRTDLDRAEAENIFKARSWVRRSRGRQLSPLTSDRLRDLHRRMFGEVWSWAGTLRRRETNIGVEPHVIPVMLRDLCDDVTAQVGDGQRLAYPPEELAVRFHHRLVSIHPFPNGNGRHARFAADLLVARLGGEPFTWGGTDLVDVSDLRSEYLAALRESDRTHDVTRLLAFARGGDQVGLP